MLSVPEFEARLKGGRYQTQGDARRAAFKLLVSDKVRGAILDGIARHFGEPFKSVTRPETSTSFSSTLGEVARTKKTNSKEWRDAKGAKRGAHLHHNREAASIQGRAGGLARAEKMRREREELAAARASAIPTTLHIVPPSTGAPIVVPPVPPTVPAVPASAPAPFSAPPLSLVEIRAEADRAVRALADRMPAPVPPPPEGVEHAYKMIADSARELFESLAAAVKDEERLRPDLLRAAHSLAMLVETGNDVLISKLTSPTPKPPEAPKSTPAPVSEAAE